ncbi:MAG: hypothetical protein HKN87_20935, partial [Saprospiraceae bacterium]|nr:hypothetical protein [Saprospiraceae bacterium]
MKIYAHLALTQNESMALKAKVSNHTLLIGQDLDPKERKGAFHTCDIALGNVPSDWIKSSGKLRWMQLESTGFGSYLWLRDSPLKEKLRVTYLKGMFGIPVAETIVAGVLCLYRGLDRLVNLQAKKQWMLAPIRPTLRILHGQRVLIAGAGAIGSHAKTLFEGFGCEVTTLGRKGGSGDIDSMEAFDHLLPLVDVVVSCLPATPQTNQLFDKARFNLFKPDAIFVNVGRGSAVDETALIEALQ